MVPGFDDAKTTEMRARLDDRLGLWAVTYLLFFVKLGPGLALFLVLVFAIWIGWRWLCRKAAQRRAAWPGVRLKLPSYLRRMATGRSTSLISACEAPPPRPFCKPLGPPAPLVAIPLEVVQGPTQLVVAGPDFAEELLNG
jgi:hypothetical protein